MLICDLKISFFRGARRGGAPARIPRFEISFSAVAENPLDVNFVGFKSGLASALSGETQTSPFFTRLILSFPLLLSSLLTDYLHL